MPPILDQLRALPKSMFGRYSAGKQSGSVYCTMFVNRVTSGLQPVIDPSYAVNTCSCHTGLMVVVKVVRGCLWQDLLSPRLKNIK